MASARLARPLSQHVMAGWASARSRASNALLVVPAALLAATLSLALPHLGVELVPAEELIQRPGASASRDVISPR
jgi:hypothetical protein